MRLLREEKGFAMPVAMAVLLVVTVLAGVGTMVAIETNGFTNRDTNSKSSLEASDAGLRTALYRLNMLGTSSSSTTPQCPVAGSSPPPPSSSTNLCPMDGPESLANGVAFDYWVSGPLSRTSSCAGNWVTNSSSVLAQRCITALGLINGNVLGRTQSRVVSYSAITPFANAGLVGYNQLSISPGQGHNGQINAEIGSAQDIALGNNVTVNGNNGTASELGTGGTMTTGNGDQISGTQVTGVDPTTFKLPYADPKNTNQGIGTVYPAAPGTPTYYNSDDRIASCSPTPPSTADQCSPSGIWTNTASQPRWVTVPNSGSLTFSGTDPLDPTSGGVYNFCNFTTGNNATINIALGARITIYIDSPSDPNSGCPSGSGTFSLGNNTIVNNPNTYVDSQGHTVPDPTALKILIVGNSQSPSSSVVTWNNNYSGITPLTLYAPNSIVNLQNNGTLTGGVWGYQVNVTNNFTFNYSGIESTLQTTPQGAAYRSAWRQCPSIGFSYSSPTSGC